MISFDPEERPTINEVLESEWLSEPFADTAPFMVYSEMEARKDYILRSVQKQK